ncbi:hypothetical protein [Streptomyces anulatus]|uniref:hypothetical protein n=1 Tax=Streptomyces anulatus TaxID=1892 RepID=UPI001C26C16C|nr:hypothetical protein [Streptomyces anulatus]
MTLASVLDEALAAATDAEDQLMRDVFRRADLLWQCKNPDCRHDNPRGAHQCEDCGFMPNGKRIGDRRPPLVSPAELEDIRAALRQHFASAREERPDAVSFDLNSVKEWAPHFATLHCGAQSSPADFSDTKVAEVLEELDRAPDFGAVLRVALHH